eukprot:CAMPEP_0169413370 /NCGR_PEP_ID=MMETSP1017-20121227/61317_1 /TAXON_ID=342587 /ORGANISM="Karlodinium micrum, Strain CCMP2283" /LENGTH=165 /DNA_ID=CAMNT_0009520775 /DNA_START=197 /DNA_END=694 /DNA_ORIENTATION=-
MVEPKWVKSNTDMDEPNRQAPKIESLDPRLAYPLIETVDPMFEKSITEMHEPKRVMPNIENWQPMRANDLSDSDAPSMVCWQTDTAEPSRAKLRKASDDPICAQSRILTVAIRLQPKIENAHPKRAIIDLRDSDEPKCKKSRTDRAEPSRPKDLSDIDDAKFPKS